MKILINNNLIASTIDFTFREKDSYSHLSQTRILSAPEERGNLVMLKRIVINFATKLWLR